MTEFRSPRALVVVGCIDESVPQSDRAAIGQTTTMFPERVEVHSPLGHESALRYALAAGASNIAATLDETAELTVFGIGGMEPQGEASAASVASARRASLVLDVLEFEPSEGDLRVTRDLGGGRLEHLCLPFPIVLTMSDQAVTPLYVSQFRQLRVTTRVAQASQERDEPRTNPPTSDWQPLRPRTHTNDLARKTSGDAHLRMFETFGLSDPAEHTRDECIISDDPENCAAHLIRYLAHHEFIDSACAPDVSVTEKVDLNLSKMPPTTQTQRPSQPTSPKLARGPRPLGYDSPANLRGPFSVRSDRR